MSSTGGHGAAHQPLLRMNVKGEESTTNATLALREPIHGQRSMTIVGCGLRGGKNVALLGAGPTNGDGPYGRMTFTPLGYLFFGNHIYAEESNDIEGLVVCARTNTFLYSNLIERASGTNIPGSYSDWTVMTEVDGNWDTNDGDSVAAFVKLANSAPNEVIGNTYIDRSTQGTVSAWSDPVLFAAYDETPVRQDELISIRAANFSGTITDNEDLADLDANYVVTATAGGFETATGTGTGMVRDATGAVRSSPKSKGYREPT